MKTTLLLCTTLFAATSWAAKPHDHGVARLDVVVEPARVTFDLDVPLEALVGFERAPRSDAERDQAKAALEKLRAAAALFRIDSAAGCTLAKVELNAPLLQPGAEAAAKEGHADLDGHFEFSCKAGSKAGFVEVGLFEAFATLKRIELQVATPKGQMKATLARPASRVALVR